MLFPDRFFGGELWVIEVGDELEVFSALLFHHKETGPNFWPISRLLAVEQYFETQESRKWEGS